MSLGGITANWILVALVLLLIPMDSWSRAMLFAVAIARAISVVIFEGPVVLRTLRGGNPEDELNLQLRNGSGDRGQVIGYGTGTLVWLLAI